MTELRLEDAYDWQTVGGGSVDPKAINWYDDDGRSVRFSDLQHFKLEFLKDLRDVLQDLERDRVSPLRRLFRMSEDVEAQEELTETLRDANCAISSHPLVKSIDENVSGAFTKVVGEAFEDVQFSLGMSEPSFDAIVRSLKILFRDNQLHHTDLAITRNGLGLNNLLYITMVLQAFDQSLLADDVAGKLLIIEEPEAHLHPQLQRTLYDVLSAAPHRFFSLLIVHTFTSKAPLHTLVSLTNSAYGTKANRLTLSDKLDDKEIRDLERYLDATRSTLLFARMVILVEGPAEVFLLPKMIEAVRGESLDRYGISVIPIFGTHFKSYAKLFSANGLPKKCAIVADGDQCLQTLPLHCSEDSLCESVESNDTYSHYVRSFRCQTTFERAITSIDSLDMFIATLTDLGARNAARDLKAAKENMEEFESTSTSNEEIVRKVRAKVLSSAKSHGKARFAQVASTHTQGLTRLPLYIEKALDWLLDNESN